MRLRLIDRKYTYDSVLFCDLDPMKFQFKYIDKQITKKGLKIKHWKIIISEKVRSEKIHIRERVRSEKELDPKMFFLLWIYPMKLYPNTIMPNLLYILALFL